MALIELLSADVERLMSDGSAVSRAKIAEHVGKEVFGGTLTPAETKLATEIFGILLRDAEVRVREALARTLKDSPNLPHDIAIALVNDVDSVAMPVIECSDVLTDNDLIAIVRSAGVDRQEAVAQRARISESVSGALVETHDERVIGRLVKNEGAQISTQSFDHILSDFGAAVRMQEALIARQDVPMIICEKLVGLCSERLKSAIAQRHALPASLTADIILQARELATVTLSADADGEDLAALIAELHRNGRLTPSLVFRAMCMGDFQFFELSIAQLAGISVGNAHALINDEGALGLKALYERIGLPPAQLPAVRAAIAVLRETHHDGGERDRERFSRKIIERILTQYGDLGVDFERDDLTYLLDKLGKLSEATLPAAAS